MIWARPVVRDRDDDLQATWERLGLPPTARQYLVDKLAHAHLLVTGFGLEEARFLRAREDPRLTAVLSDPDVRPGAATVSGTRAALEQLVVDARAAALPALAMAVSVALAADVPPEPLVLSGRRFAWGERTHVMGVVNVTPDSFSDGGRYATTAAAIAHGEALAAAGADLLDVGGESTRPGAAEVPDDVERARVVPVIEALRARTGLPVSVDTRKAAVARAALDAGASLVNDVSGLAHDPGLASVAATAGAALCLMHMQGTPETMQADPRYGDVVSEVLDALASAIDLAVAAGVPRTRLLIDPGIGFGKTVGHNLFLLRHLHELRVLGAPVLVGTSRKRFLGVVTGGRGPDERLPGTLASVAATAISGGADLVRVHDVAAVKDALAIADAVARAREGGDLWSPRGR